MLLKELINKSTYGTIGYISSQEDINLLEQYILYNLPVLTEYKQIIVVTNYKHYPNLVKENTQLWKKYFPNCVLIDLEINRGHSFGIADSENAIIDYCKKNNIDWLCKASNDVILEKDILDKEVDKADFYYLCGFGYAGFFPPYNYTIETALKAIYDTQEFFYPQTNFYFINTSKIDYLYDKKYIDETYNHTQSLPNYNGKVWEYIPGWACEEFLKKCVNRNNLLKYHLISKKNYTTLLNLIKSNNIYDSSHKNIMIENICHFQFPNQQIIKI